MPKESMPQPWGEPAQDENEKIRELEEKNRRLEEENTAIVELLGKVGEKADTAYMQEEEQRSLANTDDLTGLLNRKGFKEAFEKHAKNFHPDEGERRQIDQFTLVLLDLDRFKDVNDTYGHPAGDLVLQEAARYLRDQVRADDMIERYGGEEFLILLPRAEAEDILQKLDGIKFLATVENKAGEPEEIEMSFSGGMTSFYPNLGNLKEAIEVADKALYLAKQGGRNKILIAEEARANN